nr:hypothetical protein [Tanacetum cinerariifolium]
MIYNPEVHEVVEVVTAAKLVYKVTASSETVTAVSAIIPAAEPQVPAATITAALSRRRKGVVIRDPESESTTSSIIFAETKSKDKDFLLKTKEHMEEEESRAMQTINETPVEKADKRRRLNEEVKDLKRHLEIMPNEDDDVYTEATPLEVPTLKVYSRPNVKCCKTLGRGRK